MLFRPSLLVVVTKGNNRVTISELVGASMGDLLSPPFPQIKPNGILPKCFVRRSFIHSFFAL